MSDAQLEESIRDVRRFNRFYTKRIGLLSQGLLKTRFPLTHARIIFELAQREFSTARQIVDELNIDPSYLSRILNGFEKQDLVEKKRSDSDGRQRLLKLTAKGKEAFALLNERSNREVENMLRELSMEDQRRLLKSMDIIEAILEDKSDSDGLFLLRNHRPGDIGWITHRHGALYAEEYGWDETFEALVADILVKFIQKHDPKRERIWIMEKDGESVGSIMVVDAGDEVAQLRLLLVEPKVRGMGIGKRLIDECLSFSKRNGYKKIKLWTQSNLHAARHLYIKAGFKLVEERPHTSFGHDLVAQVWQTEL